MVFSTHANTYNLIIIAFLVVVKLLQKTFTIKPALGYQNGSKKYVMEMGYQCWRWDKHCPVGDARLQQGRRRW